VNGYPWKGKSQGGGGGGGGATLPMDDEIPQTFNFTDPNGGEATQKQLDLLLWGEGDSLLLECTATTNYLTTPQSRF